MTLDGSEITINRALSNLGEKYLNYFGQLLCGRHGEVFTSATANKLRCSHEKRFFGGPDEYQGFVQVKLFNQWQSVCPSTSPSEARHMCRALGFHHTSFVVNRSPYSTNKTLDCTSGGCRIQINSVTTSSCRKMLRCRRRCDNFANVNYGHGCSAPMLEGDTCFQACDKAGKPGIQVTDKTAVIVLGNIVL